MLHFQLQVCNLLISLQNSGIKIKPFKEYRQYIMNRQNESQATLASDEGPSKRKPSLLSNF